MCARVVLNSSSRALALARTRIYWLMKEFFATVLLLRAAISGASWVGYTMHTRVEACKSLTPSRRFGHVHALMVEDPEQGWMATLDELHKFADSWGNSNAPINTPLGRWCATQRRLNTLGELVDERVVRASPSRECDSRALSAVPFIPSRRHLPSFCAASSRQLGLPLGLAHRHR